ncbi:MAG TPA: 4Fe-4S binding protein, partial [Calditrichaeota bacterium]|nr:4Fe-4S binding protein [Calditrichota bacterium]
MNQKILSNRLIIVILSITALLIINTMLWAQAEGAKRALGFFDVWLLSRVWVGAIFCLIGLVLLVKSRVTQKLRFFFLALMFSVFAILPVLPLGKFAQGLGVHPSPVCTITNPFLFINAGKAVPVIFLSILTSMLILTVIGNKLFCGWVCPIGALQEIFHRIPLPNKFKIKLPFKITNSIRIVIFILFIIITFTAGISIYEYFNPFEFLHWGFESLAIAVIIITFIASLFLFRPFCYLVCPFGLLSWIFEHFSIIKIRVNKNLC